MKLNKKNTLLILGLLTAIALGLRIYRLGKSNFIEEENSTIKTAAYLYYCHQDKKNCQENVNPQEESFSSRFWALILANETKPNLLIRSYLWNFVSQQPTKIHQSRAWPQLLAVSWIYQLFGVSEWSSRLIPVLAGTLLIPAGWLLAKYLSLSNRLSLIYAFSLTFAFPLIQMSRNSRMYSLFVLIFLIVINQKFWKKPVLGIVLLVLAYWLHLLTLILPIALLVYSFYLGIIKHQSKVRWLLGLLLGGLLILIGLKYQLSLDLFYHYFWSFRQQPNWQYLGLAFNFPLPWPVSLLILILSLKKILASKKLSWLMAILLTYLGFLIFCSQMPAAGAYVIQLLPLSLGLIIFSLNNLTKEKPKLNLIVLGLWMLMILVRLAMGFNYLYFNKNGQAKISQAYKIIINQIKPNEQILGIQIRDYYLQDLASNTPITNLPEKQSLELTEFINLAQQSSGSFVVWEKEKIIHFKPEVMSYIKDNFKQLAGESLDNNLVEIYYYPK